MVSIETKRLRLRQWAESDREVTSNEKCYFTSDVRASTAQQLLERAQRYGRISINMLPRFDI
jgi:hypothetical protein